MNRGERRAKARKRKGGCNIGITIGGKHHSQNDVISPILQVAVEAGKKDRMEKTLRSKQVPGH